MKDTHNATMRSHAAHTAPVRRSRGWEQRMQGDYAASSRNQTDSSQPHLKIVPPVDETEVIEEPAAAGCPPCHRGMLVCLMLILGLSIPLVFSSSIAFALDDNLASTYYMWRQVIFVLVGFGAMIFISRLQRNTIKKLVWVLYGVTLLGLIATKWSPLGHTSGGVERWIKLGPFPFQVSEFAKITLLLALASYWSTAAKLTHSNSFKSTFPWIFSGIVLTLPIVLLVLMQPHLSAALVLFSLLLIVAFFAGVPGLQYAKIFGTVVLSLGVIIGLSSAKKMPFLKEYQQERIAHFLSSDKNDQAGNYQTAQGLRAIERGGWIGVGPGNSLFKQGHLPAPHTDFILAVTGEEWGVLGMLVLLSLYGLLIFFCLQVGHTAGNTFEMLVATGMGMLLFVQVFSNMGVVLGILPVTGMLLPFISYGGSGLVCLSMGMGLVLGISRHQE